MHNNKKGTRVLIKEFSENPIEGIQNNLIFEDINFPNTSKLKPNDVVISVKSAAVGWVDLLMTSGQYQHMPRLPYVPGLEYSGVVSWTGSNVPSEPIKVGTRVHIDGLIAGPRTSGDYQQYV